MFLSSKRVFSRLGSRVIASRGIVSADNPKKLFLLEYKFVENVLEARKPFRAAHLAFANDAAAAGKLLAGGALNPPSHGMLLFNCNKEEVVNFAANDPYTVNKVAVDYSIKEWTVVVGTL